MRRLLLGIDVGTGGAKALLLDEAGGVLGRATTPYPILTPRPLWSEQQPEQWWDAVKRSMMRVLRDADASGADVVGIGLTGQMHGLVALDANGNVIRPCILWNDQRTVKECDALHERIGRGNVQRICGKPAMPSFTAPKILWMRAHEPENYARMATVLLPKDYIRYRLTGTLLSDVSDASGTLLFDTERRDWSAEMLDALDIPRRLMPDVTESPEPSAYISTQAADECGVRAGIPVAAGAGDQAAEALGCGVLAGSDVSVTIGTSGVVFAGMDTYRADAGGRVHSYCHAVPGAWHVMGVMLSAGGSFRWYRDTFCAEEIQKAADFGIDAYDLLTEHAERVNAGCDGLIFLPYLTGERTPHGDPYARGVFFGATLRHERHHFTRAVMEGVCFGLKDALLCMNELGFTPSRIRVSGGGARSELWRRMLADVLMAEAVTVNVTEGAAFGAALLGGVACGAFPSIESAVERIVRTGDAVEPGPDADIYSRMHARYQALYQALQHEFAAVQHAL